MKFLRPALILVELFIAITAIAGGLALIFTNGLSMPATWLSGWFSSYVGPGLILSFIVGGTNLTAGYLVWKKSKLALVASAIAGFGMIIFEFFELYITRQNHFLQIFYFSLGVLILTLVIFMLLANERNIRRVA